MKIPIWDHFGDHLRSVDYIFNILHFFPYVCNSINRDEIISETAYGELISTTVRYATKLVRFTVKSFLLDMWSITKTSYEHN